MNFLKETTVGVKLLTGFSLMIAFIAIVSVSSYFSLNKISHDLEEIFSIRLPSVDYLLQADRDLQQLLVAERSMIFANAKSEAFKGFVKEYEINLEQANTRWGKFKALHLTEQEKALIPKYETARKKWMATSRRVVDQRIADTRNGRREAIDLTLSDAKDQFEAMRDSLDKLTEMTLGLAASAEKDAAQAYKRAIITLIIVSVLGLTIGILLAFFIGRGVTKPLKAAIEGITEASSQVASGSEQLSETSQQLANGSSDQAASIEETSSSLEEMSSMTKQNANNAGEADILMKQSLEIVNRSNASMENLTHSMEDISNASNETSKIIKTIDEIAFQTNLLALNAAVEAARAGEAGAGFAVVADEVRNLAMRAAEAAKDTASLIEGTVQKVEQGSQLVAGTNEEFQNVAQSASKVGDLVSEIASASTEQSKGIDQVNQAVSQMDTVVQQNASNAEESASAAEEMSSQAATLKSMVGQLIKIVGGQQGSLASHDAPRSSIQTDNRKKSQIKNTKAGRAISTKKGEVRPEQVIPFDDEDFKDF